MRIILLKHFGSDKCSVQWSLKLQKLLRNVDLELVERTMNFTMLEGIFTCHGKSFQDVSMYLEVVRHDMLYKAKETYYGILLSRSLAGSGVICPSSSLSMCY